MDIAQQFACKIIDFCNLKDKLQDNVLNDLSTELIALYNQCFDYLDKKFLSEINTGKPNNVYSRMWEIIIANYLLKNCKNVFHKDKGPDWEIILNNGHSYYVEAVCAHHTADSEISKTIFDFQNKGRSHPNADILIREVQSRISNAIDSKIKKHQKLLTVDENKDKGYILAVSYGSIPFYATCNAYNAVQTITTIGHLTLQIDRQYNTIMSQYLSYQESFLKPSSGAKICTHILGNEKYDWISAILFSKVEPFVLLNTAEKILSISWRDGIKNDFVLVHNPVARCPLKENIFSSATQLFKEEDEWITIGRRIFP